MERWLDFDSTGEHTRLIPLRDEVVLLAPWHAVSSMNEQVEKMTQCVIII